jgi:hypothetical protein
MSNIPAQYRPPKATLTPMVSARRRYLASAQIVLSEPDVYAAAIVSDDGTRALTSDDGKYYLTYATGAL